MTNRIVPQYDPNKVAFYRQEVTRLSNELQDFYNQLDSAWVKTPLYEEFKRISLVFSPSIASDFLINKDKDFRDIPLRYWDVSTSILHYDLRFNLVSPSLLLSSPSLIFVDLVLDAKVKPLLEFYFRDCVLKEGNAMSLGYAIAWHRVYESLVRFLIEPECNTKPSCVYFIANAEKTMVKIGYTSEIVRRFNTLQTNSSSNLVLLGTVNGGKSEEQFLHKKYSLLRSHGEWFCATKDLLKDIETMTKKNRTT